MIAAFLAAFFFALTGTCGTNNIKSNGPVRGNLGRLLVAAFHPELTDDTRIHELFLNQVREGSSVRA